MLPYEFVDLSHCLTASAPTWPGDCAFRAEVVVDYADGCRVMHYQMPAGIGTHMDAPSHFAPAGRDIAALPLEELIVPMHVIDISAKCTNPDYLLSAGDIAQFEREFGTIAGGVVLARTGWDRFWGDAEAYRNRDAQGTMHFPGFDPQAAALLLEKRIVGIGLDTLSPDGGNLDFPVHRLLLNKGKYIIENLTGLHRVPNQGAYLIALPIKVAGGTEAAIRAVGIIPQGAVDAK